MYNKILSYLIVVISIMCSYQIITTYNEKEIENNKIEYTLTQDTNQEIKKDIYDSILIIPKISLRKGIYTKTDKRNNIEENIMIHKNSIYPDTDNSNIILIAHSGSGKKAFFKDLDKLDTDSLIEFYYKKTKYVYKIDNIYKVEKNGEVKINRDKNKKTITLITCDQQDKTKQVVYIGYIIDEIKY